MIVWYVCAVGYLRMRVSKKKKRSLICGNTKLLLWYEEDSTE